MPQRDDLVCMHCKKQRTSTPVLSVMGKITKGGEELRDEKKRETNSEIADSDPCPKDPEFSQSLLVPFFQCEENRHS